MPKEPLYPHVPKSKQTQVKTVISDQRIEDLLCSAFEGGSNYWYIIKSFNYPPGATKQSLGITYPHIELPLKGGSLTVGDIEGDLPDKVLDRLAINNGLEIMARNYPTHYADFLAENDDATTADVFLQCAVFGEVVLG